MTAPAEGATETAAATHHALVILNRGAGSTRLANDFTARGWRVCVAGITTGEVESCTDEIIDFLAQPGSPDRAVLVGYGPAGPAAVEIADRHPERVAAVVVVGTPSGATARLGRRVAELCCPALELSTADPEVVVSRVDPFLAGLDRRAGAPVTSASAGGYSARSVTGQCSSTSASPAVRPRPSSGTRRSEAAAVGCASARRLPVGVRAAARTNALSNDDRVRCLVFPAAVG